MIGKDRKAAREIAGRFLQKGDALGWFEELYSQADGDPSIIPWADLEPNPNLVEWLDAQRAAGNGSRALKIGCGLGDDAEELNRRGFVTTAFDISLSAIAWCRGRFTDSKVDYSVADLFHLAPSWSKTFDLVVESYTLQVLPPDLRSKAIEAVADLVAENGTLLVIARARNEEDPAGTMPWPITRSEMQEFKTYALLEKSFEDYMDREEPPVRRFRATYNRKTTENAQPSASV